MEFHDVRIKNSGREVLKANWMAAERKDTKEPK